jgi:hypothetical protein
MQTLPLPRPDKLKGAPWYIARWTNPERASVTKEELTIRHKTGCVGMDSGSGFRARPFSKLPADHVVLNYEVFFPQDFKWVKGGKLPGVSIGAGDIDASGGDWKEDGGSFRVMFREEGQAIAYVYLPLQICKKGTKKQRDGTLEVQGREFKKAAVGTAGKHAGLDLWFKHGEPLQLKKGAWNTICVEVRLNTVGKANGFLGLTVNGQKRTLDSVVYRTDSDVHVNWVLFASFFGGSTDDWEAKKQEKILYRNFSFASSS